jgi:hypothetical protein
VVRRRKATDSTPQTRPGKGDQRRQPEPADVGGFEHLYGTIVWAGVGYPAVVPSLMLPPGLVKWLPRLEYVAGSPRNLEYARMSHETGPRKK